VSDLLPPRDAIDIVRSLPHLAHDEAQLILVTGKRGSGKTWLIREWAQRLEPRALYLDIYRSFPDVEVATSLEAALEDLAYWEACRRRVLAPRLGTREWFEYALRRILEHPLRDCLVVLDEVTKFIRTQSQSDALEEFVLQGRQLGLRAIVGCQVIQMIPRLMLSEGTTLISFRVTRPRDKDVLAEWGGPEAAELAPQLTRGRALEIML